MPLTALGRRKSFNSRTPGGVRRIATKHKLSHETVSIHAPREGCDYTIADPNGDPHVSIHAPREGCDRRGAKYSPIFSEFQFTHPGRGATSLRMENSMPFQSFNSRTPGGVRHRVLYDGRPARQVSIHAPREGCDGDELRSRSLTKTVSIHAPREGCDEPNKLFRRVRDVSIHAPREGCDHVGQNSQQSELLFQFTHPGRGATRITTTKKQRKWVSIHAPREGCDAVHSPVRQDQESFNSRTPGGVRLRSSPES